MEADQIQALKEGNITDPLGEHWRDVYLTEAELKDDPTLITIKDIPSLAKLAVETRKTLGRWSTEKGILRPKEGAPPEEVEQFHQALGRPDKPEGYEIAAPADLPKDFPYAPELEKQYRQWVFEEGLSKTQAESLYKKYLLANVQQYQEAGKVLEKGMQELATQLQKEWGDKYQENFALAQKAMRQYAPPGSVEYDALDRAIGESPVLIKMFYTIGHQMGEAAFVKGSAIVSPSLLARKAELEAHPAMLKGDHPDHDKVVKEFNEILKQIVAQEEAQEKK